MNMFQFAIASIVDANTGNGLVHGASGHDYSSFEKHGRLIRSRSVIDLARAIESRIAEFVRSRRAKARQRRDLKQLLVLNDHLLEDIGLQRSDLQQVQFGAIGLEELVAQKRSQHSREQYPLNQSAPAEMVDTRLDASNEKFYELRECA